MKISFINQSIFLTFHYEPYPNYTGKHFQLDSLNKMTTFVCYLFLTKVNWLQDWCLSKVFALELLKRETSKLSVELNYRMLDLNWKLEKSLFQWHTKDSTSKSSFPTLHFLLLKFRCKTVDLKKKLWSRILLIMLFFYYQYHIIPSWG